VVQPKRAANTIETIADYNAVSVIQRPESGPSSLNPLAEEFTPSKAQSDNSVDGAKGPGTPGDKDYSQGTVMGVAGQTVMSISGPALEASIGPVTAGMTFPRPLDPPAVWQK
jgi:hypothetical protein